MWMEETGKGLSEAGVRMGRMKGSGESGYLLDRGPLHPSGHLGPWSSTQKRSCTSPATRTKASPRPLLGVPKDDSPLKAGRGLRVPLSSVLPELGGLLVGSQGQ